MKIEGARRSLHVAEKCGDAFAWWRDESAVTICLVDGLGHGEQAAKAADAALAHAVANSELPADQLIRAIDAGIRWSRGAAIAVTRIDPVGRTLSYFGIGNVRAGLYGAKAAHFDGTPGIVGAGCKSPREEAVSWSDGDLLILWTDGFNPRLKIDPGSLRLKGDLPALAQRLIEQFATGHDDAGIVCCLLEGADT
jgi:negative regulator of sigma-B (phosphoserine phosphatase)